MLMLFPIVALVFGASALASSVLQSAFTSADAGGVSNFGEIVAAAALAVPLFAVPMILKKSLDGLGSIGASINGMGSRLGGSIGKKGQDKANSAYANSRLGQYNAYRKGESDIRRARIQAGTYTGKGGNWNPRNWGSSLNAGLNARTGKFGSRASMLGDSLESKAFEEDVASASVAHATMTRKDLMSMADGTNANATAAQRTAAIRNIMKTGNFNERRQVIASSAGADKQSRAAIKEGYYASGDSKIYGAQLGDSITSTGLTGAQLDAGIQQQVVDGNISAETLVGDDKTTKAILDAAIASGNQDVMNKIADKAVEARTSATTSSHITDAIGQHLTNIEKLRG
jgi:hypothetical protein